MLLIELWVSWMIDVLFEVMRYFGLNYRLSSGVKLKLNELRGSFTLKSQINSDYEMKLM